MQGETLEVRRYPLAQPDCTVSTSEKSLIF